MGKDSFLHMRTTEEFKAALELAAADDHRSVASLVEKVLSEWLSEHNYLPARGDVAKRVRPAPAASRDRRN